MSHGGQAQRRARLACTYDDFIAQGVGGRTRVNDTIACLEALGLVEVRR